MDKEQLQKEWQELIEEYGLENLQRWFISFKGYEVNRMHKTYEQIKDDLNKLII